MKSPEELAVIVEALKMPVSYQQAAWQKVIEVGRNYAMMKAHGCYIENGRKMTGSGDPRPMIQYFEQNLLREVRNAFVEDALFGAAISDQIRE